MTENNTKLKVRKTLNCTEVISLFIHAHGFYVLGTSQGDEITKVRH